MAFILAALLLAACAVDQYRGRKPWADVTICPLCDRPTP
jgi:hypothetical protein